MTYTNTLIRFRMNETDVTTIIQTGDGSSGVSSYLELGYVNIPQNRRASGLKSIFTSFSFYTVSGSILFILLIILFTRLKQREHKMYGSYDEEDEDEEKSD